MVRKELFYYILNKRIRFDLRVRFQMLTIIVFRFFPLRSISTMIQVRQEVRIKYQSSIYCYMTQFYLLLFNEWVGCIRFHRYCRESLFWKYDFSQLITSYISFLGLCLMALTAVQRQTDRELRPTQPSMHSIVFMLHFIRLKKYIALIRLVVWIIQCETSFICGMNTNRNSMIPLMTLVR